MDYGELLCSIYSKPTKSSSKTDIRRDGESRSYDAAHSFFSELETLCILGKQYPRPIDEKELLKDVSTRFWFTYRKGFSPINGNGPDSDQGWGCMIRCGQMLLAETFLRMSYGRNFVWSPEENGKAQYWTIMGYFRDEKLAPYSVQQIAVMGATEGISIGRWFGPNAIAQVLNKLTTFTDSNHLRFYIAMDNCVFTEEIIESLKKCNKSIDCKEHKKRLCETWSPLLLIIPLRLGLNEFNSDYKENLKKCFHSKYSVGMIGGKPNQAYYFYGYADDELLYMDPHKVQPYVKDLFEKMDDSTYHTNTMWKLKFTLLDPSVALGFVCNEEEDFWDLIESLQNDVCKKGDTNSLFEIYEKRPDYDNVSNLSDYETKSDDEFILL